MTEANLSTQRDLDVIGTLSFAYLAEPFPSKKDDGTIRMVYKTHVILDPATPEGAAQIAKIKEASKAVAQAAWGEGYIATMQQLAAKDVLALHAGETMDLEKNPQYAGKFFISTNYNPKPGASTKPPCVATLGTPPANVLLEPGHPNFPYSGCKAAVKISLYAQSPNGKPSKYGKRINCQLKGVQFLAHGKAFGGGGPRLASVNEFAINPLDADGAMPASAEDMGAAGGLI